MYLEEAIWHYTKDDWDLLLINFNKDDSETIKSILIMETKEEIESKFYMLENLWIINWIWPQWLKDFYIVWPSLIWMTTTILFLVKSAWHDIMFFIWGTRKEKDKADLNLLKYSMLSSIAVIEVLILSDIPRVLAVFFTIIYFPIFMIHSWVCLILWLILVIFWNKAFRFTNKTK